MSIVIDNLKSLSEFIKKYTYDKQSLKFKDPNIILSMDDIIFSFNTSSINLSNRNIDDVNINTLMALIVNVNNLLTLNLSFNRISDKGVNEITEKIKTLTSLDTLVLEGNYIGQESLTNLIINLPNSLTKLYLSFNDIQNECLIKLTNKLQSLNKLTHLHLANTNIGINKNKMELLIKTLPKSLIDLNLADNNIGPDGVSVIATKLQTLPSLNSLNLSNNNIGPDSIINLISNLSTSLRRLFLSGNNLGNTDFEILVDKLPNFNSLTDLYLGYNDINTQVLYPLMINLPTSLIRLDLSSCNIDKKGAAKLATRLTDLTVLESLSLTDNNIRSR